MAALQNIRLDRAAGAVVILDQSKLPGQIVYRALRSRAEMVEAIRALRVRGAPAIGICAGYCLYLLACGIEAADADAFLTQLRTERDALAASRPTAVNLRWALDRMMGVAEASAQQPRPVLLERLRTEAERIHAEDRAMCRAIAEHGLSLLRDGMGILTHCNAGPLATSDYGTALGPLLLGRERGMQFSVYADETRPLLQGARLTAFELGQAGVDVTLICDNMASLVMAEGRVEAVLVGCDRVARNGDTANKIGTSGLAILARHYGIPFYVLGPGSTIDFDCADGRAIPIELRDPDEIAQLWYRERMAPAGVRCYNPAFDVTDHRLITAIITERGICYPPFDRGLAAMYPDAALYK